MIKIVIINPLMQTDMFGMLHLTVLESQRLEQNDVYKKMTFSFILDVPVTKSPFGRVKNLNLQLNILKSQIMGAKSTN